MSDLVAFFSAESQTNDLEGLKISRRVDSKKSAKKITFFAQNFLFWESDLGVD